MPVEVDSGGRAGPVLMTGSGLAHSESRAPIACSLSRCVGFFVYLKSALALTPLLYVTDSIKFVDFTATSDVVRPS